MPSASPPAGQSAAAAVSGFWATSGGNPASRLGTGSVLRRQYTFKDDATYFYYSELFDGVSS